jgi:flagellar hook-associated protein 3 FlgL
MIGPPWRRRLGRRNRQLRVWSEGQRSTILYLDQTRSAIEDTDVAEAMTRMAQDKVAIEASYLIVSQVSRLSLADYLR